MIDFDKFKGISPETLNTSASELLKVEGSFEYVSMLPDAVLKEAVTSIPAEKVIKAFYNVGMAARNVGITLRCAAKFFAEAVINNYYIATSPNSRVKHLAQHAKKRRVRKKNIARLKKQLKNAKGKMQSCEFVLSETEAPEDVWINQNTQGDCENDNNNN